MSQQITTNLQDKAQRLVDQDKVEHVKGFLYWVEGDTGLYRVHLSYPEEASGSCNCPSTSAVCSHILAASIRHLADQIINTQYVLVPTDVVCPTCGAQPDEPCFNLIRPGMTNRYPHEGRLSAVVPVPKSDPFEGII